MQITAAFNYNYLYTQLCDFSTNVIYPKLAHQLSELCAFIALYKSECTESVNNCIMLVFFTGALYPF